MLQATREKAFWNYMLLSYGSSAQPGMGSGRDREDMSQNLTP